MAPFVKFCGLTRAPDAAYAARLGAEYVGAIFAASPRMVSVDQARQLYRAARATQANSPGAVAVFGPGDESDIAAVAAAAGADIVQLHGAHDAATISRLRNAGAGEIWSVLSVSDGSDLGDASLDGADALLLDTSDALRLGGSGRAFDWQSVADALHVAGRPRKLVLAGGLRPSNVGVAIRLLRPDIVDVSSGVESSPGIKDHALMRAFVEAVAQSGRH